MFETVILSLSVYLLAVVAARLLRFEQRRADGARQRAIGAVDRLLPQTQCGACGHPGCRPYARAIVEQAAPLNLCPPGGVATLRRLEQQLGGVSWRHAPPRAHTPALAVIDERACIGCMKCITACPVDAIVGSAGQLHSVIAQYCTGCKLCIPPCPVDCIAMTSA